MTSQSLLDLRGIHKSYGTLKVLCGVDATIMAGRIAALVGPNGAGKTTLLRIAAGLQYADAGTVEGEHVLYYGGFDTLPVRATANRLRRGVGLPPVDGGARRLSALSRGELQTVGLDIAFELSSDVLLLDEPWTALEPDAREALNERIRECAAPGRVVVCSTHDIDQVRLVADEVWFMGHGQAVCRRREDFDGQFDRDELLRLYRTTAGR